MLLWWIKENRPAIFGALLLCLVLAACKDDTSTVSSEEQAYLADYEAPAHKWGFMDTTGRLMIPPSYDDVGPFREGLAAFNQKGKWGYINPKGQVVIEARYQSAWAFAGRLARITPFGGDSHFIRRDGSSLTPDSTVHWIAADDFSDGLAKVTVGNTFGYVDTTGQLTINPIYSRAWNFDAGLARVEFKGKLGVINRQGSTVLPCEFDHIRMAPDKLQILTRKDSQSQVYDWEGKELYSVRDAVLTDTDGVLVAIRQNRDYRLEDIRGGKVSDDRLYQHLMYLDDGRWAAKQFDGFTLLNEDGQPLPPGGYSQVNHFADGYAVYSKNGYWGYLDHAGKEVVGHPFGLAWDFKNGFARAAFQEGIGFLNRNLELAFYPPPGTLDMRDFSEGLAPVQIAR